MENKKEDERNQVFLSPQYITIHTVSILLMQCTWRTHTESKKFRMKDSYLILSDKRRYILFHLKQNHTHSITHSHEHALLVSKYVVKSKLWSVITKNCPRLTLAKASGRLSFSGCPSYHHHSIEIPVLLEDVLHSQAFQQPNNKTSPVHLKTISEIQ